MKKLIIILVAFAALTGSAGAAVAHSLIWEAHGIHCAAQHPNGNSKRTGYVFCFREDTRGYSVSISTRRVTVSDENWRVVFEAVNR